MIHWNKKTYARELKKGYWDLEPHFFFYSMIELFDLYRTYQKHKMSVDDVQSALYGNFIMEGKPILKDFYNNFNAMSMFIDAIIKDIKKKTLYNTLKIKRR